MKVSGSKRYVVYVDMDDVLCDYTSAFNDRLRACPEVAYPQSQFGFFSSLNPMKGGVEGIKYLISNDYDVYILTAPSYKNPLCYTEKRVWVERYFGVSFCERLIICSNKGLLKGDVLIDDHASGKGQENFEGNLIHFGSSRYKGWSDVMRVFT